LGVACEVPPPPALFSELRILKELQAPFLELRILKEIASSREILRLRTNDAVLRSGFAPFAGCSLRIVKDLVIRDW